MAQIDQPKNCCGTPPIMFRDKKVGRKDVMVIVMCTKCGRFKDGHTTTEAVQEWNTPNHK